MTVFEVVYPGCRIEVADRDFAFTLERYLLAIESRLSDAAVSLHLFEQAQARDLAARRGHRDADSQEQQSSDDFLQLAQDYGNDAQAFLAEMEKRALASKRQRWLAGELPRAYTSRLPFLHARMFLFSLWDIVRLLGQVGRCTGTPAKAIAAIEAVEATFPTLKSLRDSAKIENTLPPPAQAPSPSGPAGD